MPDTIEVSQPTVSARYNFFIEGQNNISIEEVFSRTGYFLNI